MSPPTAQDFPKPESITGGCLCGSVRYKVEFEKDHDFLKSSGTCQCTQCRRQTGTLIFYAHTVKRDSLTWLTPAKTLKIFSATPGFQRGFCTNCGSFLYWRDEKLDEYEITLGCVDPEHLAGYGFALGSASGSNVWCENEVAGVTDGLPVLRGTRWAKSSEAGIKMRSGARL